VGNKDIKKKKITIKKKFKEVRGALAPLSTSPGSAPALSPTVFFARCHAIAFGFYTFYH